MSIETPFVLKVRLHISEHLHQPNYHIDDLCNTLEISRSQVYRKLKIQIGKSFSQLLNEARIKKSGILLENMELNISEIAFTMGFKDPSYFVKVFKKQMSVTPGKYKSEIREKWKNARTLGRIESHETKAP